MELLTQELEDELRGLSDKEKGRFVFLEEHSEIDHHWHVESFSPGFFRHFEGVLGKKRLLNPFSFPAFMERADEEGFRVVFFEDPTAHLDWGADLMAEPEVGIASKLVDTPSGMFPFQVQGYNFLKHLDGGVANWSTGTGKTVVAAALTRYHMERGIDLAIWVVKPHNMYNTQRALSELVNLDSMVLTGTPKQREAMYYEFNVSTSIVITNYEKFRIDEWEIKDLITDRNVFIVWDEMPTKLKSRTSKLYKATRNILYTNLDKSVRKDKQRPVTLKQIMLSATPIEKSPEDWFSCVRLIDPDIFGTVTEFHKKYVRTWSPFQQGVPLTWKNLPLMGVKAAPITHQVDKSDPDIASQFPEVIEDEIYVDMTDQQQQIYDRLMKVILEDGSHNDLDDHMMSKIGVAQMVVNHPLGVLRSAKMRASVEAELEAGGFPTLQGSALAMKLVDVVGEAKFKTAGSAKLDALEEVLDTMEDGDKTIVFTAFNKSLIPLLSAALTTWGYPHVTYTGEMSAKQKQEAEDEFRHNPDCGIFLSSDAGSDSINLEVASMVVHYDLPWKWSTVIQRQNRAHRITSQHKTIRYFALLASGSVESRKQEIIAAKQGYHDQIFKGAVADQSESMRLTNKDLLYILTGRD